MYRSQVFLPYLLKHLNKINYCVFTFIHWLEWCKRKNRMDLKRYYAIFSLHFRFSGDPMSPRLLDLKLNNPSSRRAVWKMTCNPKHQERHRVLCKRSFVEYNIRLGLVEVCKNITAKAKVTKASNQCICQNQQLSNVSSINFQISTYSLLSSSGKMYGCFTKNKKIYI